MGLPATVTMSAPLGHQTPSACDLPPTDGAYSVGIERCHRERFAIQGHKLHLVSGAAFVDHNDSADIAGL